MEPFDYPDNDPGPQTLLTSLTPQQNVDRLYWLMSRFQGYVGLINMMGARFTASEQSFAPDPARSRKARPDIRRRRLQSAQRCRTHRRRQQPALCQGRRDNRFRADTRRDRPRAGPTGNGRARTSSGRRHRVGASGIDRAHRQMGEGGGEPRLTAGADHGGRPSRKSRPDGRRKTDAIGRSMIPRLRNVPVASNVLRIPPYRPCVGMMVLNRAGLVFIGRRIEGPEHIDETHAWQMPQGGIDPGEQPWPAALRELREETNISLGRTARRNRRVAELRNSARDRRPCLERQISRPDAEMVRGALHRRGKRNRRRASRRQPRRRNSPAGAGSRCKTSRTSWCRSSARSTSAW